MRRAKDFHMSPPPIVRHSPAASAAPVQPSGDVAPAHLSDADAIVWRQFRFNPSPDCRDRREADADDWASITQAERDGRRAFQEYLDKTRNYRRAVEQVDRGSGVAALGRDYPLLRP